VRSARYYLQLVSSAFALPNLYMIAVTHELRTLPALILVDDAVRGAMHSPCPHCAASNFFRTFPDLVSMWISQNAVAFSWLIMATTPLPGAKK